MATKRPVLCPNCGAQIRKNGYCPSCHMPIWVVKKAYNTSNYYYNVGYDKATARDLSGAIESLNMSLRYNKKNVMSRNLIGLIYYEMGEVVSALSHWVLSVNYQTTNNLASHYLKELRRDPAQLDDVDQIAKKYNMALSYAESGDFDLAIIQLKGTLSANPHFVKGYLLLALLYIKEDNYEKARTTLRRVLKIDKANPMAIHYLHEMGNTDENIIHMRNESVENDGLFEDDYTDEAAAADMSTGSGSAGKALIHAITEHYRKNTVKTGAFGEVRFARYSGLYVIVGLLLGILILFFVVVPAEKRSLEKENDSLTKQYSEELSIKNSTISDLKSEIEELNSQIEELVNSEAGTDNPVPDYSDIESGMSDEDLQNMIANE